jgi:hypothetical protein
VPARDHHTHTASLWPGMTRSAQALTWRGWC